MKIEKIKSGIENWDTNNVSDLVKMINKVREHDQEFQDNVMGTIDFSSLKSQEFCNDLKGKEDFPIWCRDRRGQYLIGEQVDKVMDESELIEYVK